MRAVRLPLPIALALCSVRIRFYWYFGIALVLLRHMLIPFLPLFLYCCWLASGGVPVRIFLWGGAIYGILIWLLMAFALRRAVAAALPATVFEALEKQPQIATEIGTLCKDLRAPAPRALAPTLKLPAQRNLYLDPERARDLAIPLPLAGVWSILELRCHLAHALVRGRCSARKIESYLGWLNSLILQLDSNTRVRRAAVWLLQRLNKNISSWHLLADIQADFRIASKLGVSSVSSWIEKTWQAEGLLQGFANNFISPALQCGRLVPIAESYGSLQSFAAQQWDTVLTSNQQNPYRTRLEYLRAIDTSGPVFDSRPALGLVADLESIEERVVRLEFQVRAGAPLKRVSLAEYGDEVIVPLMRSEIERNAKLFDGKTVESVPQLARTIKDWGASYLARPGFLLDANQRLANSPNLLVWFFSQELTARGWTLMQESWAGLRLSLGDRVIFPADVVNRLLKQEMSNEEFERIIASSASSSRMDSNDTMQKGQLSDGA